MKITTLLHKNRLNKKLYSLLISLLITLAGFSQNVSISSKDTLPNADAGLDVYFSNKGLLIPRVALTATANFAPLSAHVAGMIVFNTATAADVKPGFYYDDGTKWVTGFPVGGSIGDMLYWNGTAWVLIPAGTSGQYLQLSGGNTPMWGGTVSASLTTTAATLITGITATSGGNITSDAGSAILQRGICWNTTTGPTIANSKIVDGAAGIGAFVSNLTGLLPVTTYYVRAYSMNSNSITYGNEITFTTLPVLPTLAATTAATLVTGTTATTGGNVTSTGGATITERGICYSTTLSSPTTANTTLIDPTPGLGVFVSNMTGLNPSTTYYVRAYATNSVGTAYGAYTAFSTRPVVTTTVAGSITGATAISGGVLTGGTGSWYYGVAYSTVSNAPTPTLVQAGSFPSTSPLTFTASLTGLTASTTYYIRGYVTGPSYTVYGPELSFTTTAPTAPVIASTTAITGLSDRTATTGGSITSDGGSPVTAKGVCWSTSASPVIGSGNFTSDGTGTATFVSNISGLSGSTIYYVRAYATNSIGTSYGPVDVSFTTWVTAPYVLGQNLGYGYVGYINNLGHGFIYSYDIPYTGGWGCNGITLGCSSALGTGLANTLLIIANAGAVTTAASTARAYSVTYNGVTYNNWYLPSSGEWAYIAAQRITNGLWNMGYQNYYTSSEYVSGNTYAGTYWNTGASCSASGTSRLGGTTNFVYYLKVIMDF